MRWGLVRRSCDRYWPCWLCAYGSRPVIGRFEDGDKNLSPILQFCEPHCSLSTFLCWFIMELPITGAVARGRPITPPLSQ